MYTIKTHKDIKSINKQNNSFFTKDGRKIFFIRSSVNLKIKHDFINSFNLLGYIRSFYAIQAIVDKEPAGYILLAYISRENKEKYLNNVTDWWIHKYAPESTQLLWIEAKDNMNIHEADLNKHKVLDYVIKSLSLELDTNDLNNSNIQQKIDSINKHLENTQHYSAYISFIEYWVNKPNVEYSCIYNQEDKKYKTFNKYPFEQKNRKTNNNFRGLGIAQSLYEVATLWMNDLNLDLYASKTQTKEGQKMWTIFDTLPKFKVMTDTFLTTSTTNRKVLIEEKRKKLTLN